MTEQEFFLATAKDVMIAVVTETLKQSGELDGRKKEDMCAISAFFATTLVEVAKDEWAENHPANLKLFN